MIFVFVRCVCDRSKRKVTVLHIAHSSVGSSWGSCGGSSVSGDSGSAPCRCPQRRFLPPPEAALLPRRLGAVAGGSGGGGRSAADQRRRRLVGAGGVLGLCPRSLRYALAKRRQRRRQNSGGGGRSAAKQRRRRLVRAGGVLGLCPRSSRNALAARAEAEAGADLQHSTRGGGG